MFRSFKVIICAALLFTISGCATVMNHNKPPLRDNKAIGNAEYYDLIEMKYSYFIGDLLFALIPIGGWVLAPLGIAIDIIGNNSYVVVDRAKYEVWKAKYLKNLNKERETFLKEDSK